MRPTPIQRLALVITTLGTAARGGGAHRALTLLANRWADQGRVVRIFILSDAPDCPCFPLHESVRVHALGECVAPSPIVHAWRAGGRVRRLRTALREFRPDAIVSFLTGPNVNAILAAGGLGMPLAVCERINWESPVPEPYRLLRSMLYRFAHAIVVQTEAAARHVPWSSRTVVIPNPVLPHPAPKQVHREGADRLVAVGGLTKEKDHATLINAVAQLKDRHPALSLTIYGEGGLRDRLTALIKARGLEDRVSLPGFVPDVTNRIVDFDLFVFSSRYEGFPNALGEAMSAGLPVIATRITGNDALVQDGVNGMLVPAGNPGALASAIAELHGSRARRETLGSEARRVSSTFDEDRILALWDELLIRLRSANLHAGDTTLR